MSEINWNELKDKAHSNAVKHGFCILLVSLDNFGAETSVTSVFATLNNIGPGLSLEVGPFGSYASFSALSKVVLTLDMLLGRLELFPVLLLLSPATWRKH